MSTKVADQPKFVAILEKKGRGRGITMMRPWAVRTFKLSGQSFEYYDGDKLKGTIDTKDCKVKKLTPNDADLKEFPFELAAAGEKILLNASSEDIRNKCMEFLLLSSTNKNWTLPAPPSKVEATQKEFETASNAAVVGAMQADLELKKLEEENRRLEEQRKKQVEEATAAAMADELAAMKLRQAQEAERAQREEQERQVMEMLKGMGAKTRFFAALKAGKMDVAKHAAASMLQGQWRAKLAKRKMLLKKAEKERLRREGFARKIQSRYRARLAKKKIERIKAEKLANRRKAAAIKVQMRARIYLARKKYIAKQTAKMEAELGKSISKQRGFIKVQKVVRCFLAKQRILRLRAAHPQVVVVNVTGTNGLNAPDSSEVSCFVSGLSLGIPVDSRSAVTDDMLKTSGTITSVYKYGAVSREAKNALATAAGSMEYVVVTLVDTTSGNDFLGQAFIRLSDVKGLRASAAKPVAVTVPVSGYLARVTDDRGEVAVVRKAAAGTVTVTLSVPPAHQAMSGWLWKVSEAMLSGGAWKKRWFVMVGGQLQYYNTDTGLESTKNVVLLNEVTSLTSTTNKGRNCLKIAFRHDGIDSFWMVDWDVSEAPEVKRMWLRKLHANCPALIGTELIDPVRSRLCQKNINIVKGGAQTAAPVSPMNAGKAKVSVSRRISVFK